MAFNLKECPFCGGEPVLLQENFGRETISLIYCSDCEVCTKDYTSLSGAVDSWNIRIPSESVVYKTHTTESEK